MYGGGSISTKQTYYRVPWKLYKTTRIVTRVLKQKERHRVSIRQRGNSGKFGTCVLESWEKGGLMRMRMLLASAALIAGSLVSAAAQEAQPRLYQWGYPDRAWDRDPGYRNLYANARDFGYQDGFNDGKNDRFTGHSFRPTHDGNFKHADRGYFGGYGDRNYYKHLYRQAYEKGYDQGYNSVRYRPY
jgi:hypothetical protein